jgi:hypothetical protein
MEVRCKNCNPFLCYKGKKKTADKKDGKTGGVHLPSVRASPFKLSHVNVLRTKARMCVAFSTDIISRRESIARQGNGQRHRRACRPVDR